MKISGRIAFILTAFTLLLGSSLASDTAWFNPLQRQMRFYSEDSPQFNLAQHLALDRLDSVNTEQCGEATYRGLTDETTGYPIPTPYTYPGQESDGDTNAFKGCSQPRPVAMRNHYLMLCDQTETLLLVKTSRTKGIEVVADFDFSEQLQEINQKSGLNATIGSCSSSTVMSNGTSALVVCFYPSTKSAHKGSFTILKFDFVVEPKSTTELGIQFSEGGAFEQQKEIFRKGDFFMINMFESGQQETLTITKDGITPDYTQVLTLNFENGQMKGKVQLNNYKGLFSNLPNDIRVVKADKRHLYIVSGDGSDPEDANTPHGLWLTMCSFFDSYCSANYSLGAIPTEDRVQFDIRRSFDNNQLDVVVFSPKYIHYHPLELVSDMEFRLREGHSQGFSIDFYQDDENIEFLESARVFNNVIVLAGISEKGEPAATLVWIKENNRMSINIADNINGYADTDFEILVNEDEFDANSYNLQVFGINHHILMMLSTPVVTFQFSESRKESAIGDKPTDCKLVAVFKDEKKSKFELDFSYQVVTDPKGDVSIDFPEKVKIYSSTKNTIYGYFNSMVGNAPSFKVDLVGGTNAQAKVLYADQLSLNSLNDKLPTNDHNNSQILSMGKGYYAKASRGNNGDNVLQIVKCQRNSENISLDLNCEKVPIKAAERISTAEEPLYLLQGIADRHGSKFITLVRLGETLHLVVMDHKSEEKSSTKVLKFTQPITDAVMEIHDERLIVFGTEKENREILSVSLDIKTLFEREDITMETVKHIYSHDICPVKIEYFPEETHSLLIYSECKASDGYTNSQAFRLTFNPIYPQRLSIADIYPLEGFDKPLFCSTGKHIHIIETGERGVRSLRVESYNTDSSDGSIYVFPIGEFVELSSVQDITCETSTDLVHILATRIDKQRVVVTLRGEASQETPETRIHSVIPVESSGDSRISAQVSRRPHEESILIISSTSGTSGYVFQPYSPRIIIDDTKDPKEEFMVTKLVVTNNRGQQASTIDLQIQPFEHIPSAQLRSGVKKQEVLEGDGYEYNLEESLKISGYPKKMVINSKYDSENKNKPIQRIELESSLQLDDPEFGEISGFISLDGFDKFVWSKDNIGIFSQNIKIFSTGFMRHVRDAYFLNANNSSSDYTPMIVFTSHMHGESALYLNVLLETDTEGVFKVIASDTPIGTTEETFKVFRHHVDMSAYFFQTLNSETNQITTQSFIIQDGKIVVSKGSRHVKEVEEVSSFSSIFVDHDHLVTASLVSNIKGIHFSVAKVSLDSTERGFQDMGEQVHYFSPVEGVYVDTSVSIIKCVSAGELEVDCFVATTGIFNFLANIKFADFNKRERDSLEPFVLDTSRVTQGYRTFPGLAPGNVAFNDRFALVYLYDSDSLDREVIVAYKVEKHQKGEEIGLSDAFAAIERQVAPSTERVPEAFRKAHHALVVSLRDADKITLLRPSKDGFMTYKLQDFAIKVNAYSQFSPKEDSISFEDFKGDSHSIEEGLLLNVFASEFDPSKKEDPVVPNDDDDDKDVDADEAQRRKNEKQRIQNEEARVQSESKRVEADAQRKKDFDASIAQTYQLEKQVDEQIKEGQESVKASENQLSTLNKELKALLARVEQSEKQISDLKSASPEDKELYMGKIGELSKQIDAMESELKASQEERETTADSRYKDVKVATDSYNSQLDEYRQKLQGIDSQLAGLEVDIKSKEDSMATSVAKIQEIEKNLDGYANNYDVKIKELEDQTGQMIKDTEAQTKTEILAEVDTKISAQSEKLESDFNSQFGELINTVETQAPEIETLKKQATELKETVDKREADLEGEISKQVHSEISKQLDGVDVAELETSLKQLEDKAASQQKQIEGMETSIAEQQKVIDKQEEDISKLGDKEEKTKQKGAKGGYQWVIVTLIIICIFLVLAITVGAYVYLKLAKKDAEMETFVADQAEVKDDLDSLHTASEYARL